MFKKTGIISTFLITGLAMACFTPFFAYASAQSANFNASNSIAYYNPSSGETLVGSYASCEMTDCPAFTIETWVKFDDIGASNKWIYNTDNTFGKIVYDSGVIEFLYGGSWHSISWTPTINTWYHLAFTYNYTDKLLLVYINGTLYNSSLNIGNVRFSGNQQSLGNRPDTLKESGHLKLSNFRTWDIQRTATQILNNYLLEKSSPESNLDINWVFNGNGLNSSGVNTANLTTSNINWASDTPPFTPAHSDSITLTTPANGSTLTTVPTSFTATFTASTTLYAVYQPSIVYNKNSLGVFPYQTSDCYTEFSDDSYSATTTCLIAYPNLSNGNYVAKAYLSAYGSIVASSTINSFTINDPTFPSDYTQYTPINAPTASTTCPTDFIGGAICQLFFDASTTILISNFTNIPNLLSTKIPFGILPAYKLAITALETSTTTNAYQLADLSSLNSNFMVIIDSILAMLIYVLFIFKIISRIKHIHL